MTRVYTKDKTPEAVGQTRVFIIGVGTYPWLDGGATPRGADVTGGMGQLASPPISAKEVADWFISSFHNEERPLGSVDMLVSDGDGAQYASPEGEIFDLGQATIEEIETEVYAWKLLGDANPEDMMVFFFSGHGISAGARFALLARNYGEQPGRPLKGAINLNDMLEGMKCCKALRQVYFIDACRVASDILLSNATETGNIVIPTSLPITRGWRQSVYFASLSGMAAYGQPGRPSLFAAALLNALKGPAADDSDDDWRVTTSRLYDALNHFASPLGDPDFGGVQSPQVGNQTLFDIHYFTSPPSLPIYVEPDWHEGDDPPVDMERLLISLDGNMVVDWQQPWEEREECKWGPSRFESWLTPGSCKIEWQISGAAGETSRTKHIHPPYKLFRIARDG